MYFLKVLVFRQRSNQVTFYTSLIHFQLAGKKNSIGTSHSEIRTGAQHLISMQFFPSESNMASYWTFIGNFHSSCIFQFSEMDSFELLGYIPEVSQIAHQLVFIIWDQN